MQIIRRNNGTTDARGYRQWNEVGRSVNKGSRAFYILGPLRKKMVREKQNKKGKGAQGEEVEEVEGEEEEGFAEILVGFKAIPVFRVEYTSGKDPPYFPAERSTSASRGRRKIRHESTV